MPGMEHPDLIPVVVQGVEQRIILYAGQAEQRVNPLSDKGFDDGGSGGEFGHREWRIENVWCAARRARTGFDSIEVGIVTGFTE